MKIAIIIDFWEPVTGGSQTHVAELALGLIREHDCEVDIFTRALKYNSSIYKENEEFHHGRLRIFRTGPATSPFSTWGRISTIWTIARRVAIEDSKRNYDLIHAHSILGGAIGKLASLFTKKPLLFTVHGSPNMDRGIKNFHYHIEKLIHRHIPYDKVISVGEHFKKYSNINKNIEVIQNGVHVEDFHRLEILKNKDNFKILFVGRMDWTKGIETLIDAVKILSNNYGALLNEKKVSFHLIGYGCDIEKLSHIVNDDGLGHLIKFRGKISGDELIKEYKSSHLFILPSITEGDSIVIKEAWAAGLPVISTICNAPEYYVREGIDGFLIEKQDPQKMAEAIVYALNLPEEDLDKMGQKGYENVVENFRWEVVTDKVFKIYKTLS